MGILKDKLEEVLNYQKNQGNLYTKVTELLTEVYDLEVVLIQEFTVVAKNNEDVYLEFIFTDKELRLTAIYDEYTNEVFGKGVTLSHPEFFKFQLNKPIAEGFKEGEKRVFKDKDYNELLDIYVNNRRNLILDSLINYLEDNSEIVYEGFECNYYNLGKFVIHYNPNNTSLLLELNNQYAHLNKYISPLDTELIKNNNGGYIIASLSIFMLYLRNIDDVCNYFENFLQKLDIAICILNGTETNKDLNSELLSVIKEDILDCYSEIITINLDKAYLDVYNLVYRNPSISEVYSNFKFKIKDDSIKVFMSDDRLKIFNSIQELKDSLT